MVSGDVLRLDEATVRRLLSRVEVDPATGCWLWTGGATPKGYGRFRVGGRLYYPHRLTFVHFVGELGDDEQVDHLCGEERCCNPDHLESVTVVQHVRRTRARRLASDPEPPILLVGEATVGDVPFGEGSDSGRRLAALGFPMDLAAPFNLMHERPPRATGGDGFPRPPRAAVDWVRRAAAGRTLVVAGRRAARAIDPTVGGAEFMDPVPPGRLDDAWLDRPRVAYVIPHPSGRCRWWNDPANRDVARGFFALLAATVRRGADGRRSA